ncbi:MAG: hypothetical protein CVU07_09260 [Bacteroidetes bacterium HGW-Bacteroidetes-23]|uniref:Lipoprotein n=1 Tax=Flavobacterium azooxidireducens TaxID=1871076 RepID=A0ABY4KD38_9FLAO|nr:hypothetical protein [Flavobacterium azooxidireducens]PKP15708.1 MAG: hypothetical protein CVU07_09260 [Bacteroidetes bacterium HGW-Bacteroidetes-23]UPQ78710.1 hypothetical protein M0M57_13915 [Flavobacterium azooxidireducens]
MKKVVLFGCLLVLIGCKSTSTSKADKKPEFVKLNLSEVSSVKKNRAYELGKRVLNTCNTSSFKPFTTEEATDEVLRKINKEKISTTCKNILQVFGQFKDIKLVEVIRYDDDKITLFRYKCDYEKKYKIKELRVSINDENKITAITTKDWNDTYNP